MGCSSSKQAKRIKARTALESHKPTKVEAGEAAATGKAVEAVEETAAADKAAEAAEEEGEAEAGEMEQAAAALSTIEEDEAPSGKVTIDRRGLIAYGADKMRGHAALGTFLHPGSSLEIHYEVVRNAVWDPFHNRFIDGSFAKLMWRRPGECELFALYKSARATTYCQPSGTSFSPTERGTLLRVLLDEVTSAVEKRHGKEWRDKLLEEMRGRERRRERMRAPPPYSDR
ncbi:uncharacterized protein K452DRAFT_304765 [Aplosporella prunicola CBS 121167]|uniref:Uncharacterized protein n=1 Tax=Aplosporella prunicola CBS 121167 TaxID=1176127 RepID=A0A6A6BRY5_9PEZI|nr:uncharacterized protein K452DRAFT_304765 [Aplosporella prunicola CBS 121167]KAF2146846.1 hypothetical protein K452DRAFT_304765 [Aplosporella prunicola CBS 121167]